MNRRQIRNLARFWSTGDADYYFPARVRHIGCRLGAFRRGQANLLRAAAVNRRSNPPIARAFLVDARERRERWS